MQKSTQKKSNEYGKRPLWQWILLSILIGAIVYGIIYYSAFAQKGESTNQTRQQTSIEEQDTDDSPGDATEEITITLTQKGWTPATVTIKAGQVVTWVNESGQPATVNSDPHPTHTDYPPINLGGFSNGQSLSLSFPKKGTYGYHDHLDPSRTGTIIVK